MSTRDKKRDRIKESFQKLDEDVFRTDRAKREEKVRRKKALSRFERRESKNDLRSTNDETPED